MDFGSGLARVGVSYTVSQLALKMLTWTVGCLHLLKFVSLVRVYCATAQPVPSLSSVVDGSTFQSWRCQLEHVCLCLHFQVWRCFRFDASPCLKPLQFGSWTFHGRCFGRVHWRWKLLSRGWLRWEQQTEVHVTLSTVSWWRCGSVMLVVRRSYGGGGTGSNKWFYELHDRVRFCRIDRLCENLWRRTRVSHWPPNIWFSYFWSLAS